MDSQAPAQGQGLHGEVLPDGTVHVSVDVNGPVTVVWDALSETERLERWFATVEPSLRPGARVRVDFGDGDFFDVSVVAMTPPSEIEFDWSFLGIGSPHRVRWTVRERGGGTQVEVTDRDPRRPPAEAGELVSGWSDFLDRLRRYLETGEPTRYDLRDELDGTVELPASVDDPLSSTAVLRWLPVATDGRRPRWFFVIDEQGPRRFPVSDWSLDPGRALTFAVRLRHDGGPPTRCTVRVAATPEGRRLSFQQTGWTAVGLPVHQARQLRSRFADTWREALRAVRDLSAPPAG